MATDYPIAMADTKFRLPGVSIGLPCTSPSTTISRRLSPSLTYRLLLTGESIRANQLQGAVDCVPVPTHAESTDTPKAAFESRVAEVVDRLVGAAAQPQALGKWAFWTQLSMPPDEAGKFAAKIMGMHAKGGEGREGMSAFLGKREPVWTS